MKEKTLYVCGECGYETPRWMGKCPQCGSWNTLVEEERVLSHAAAQITTKAVQLQNVRAEAQTRISTGIGELDRVLGGGLVKGMVVLLGGDPGIGKSTLLLEAADNLSASGPVLYVPARRAIRRSCSAPTGWASKGKTSTYTPRPLRRRRSNAPKKRRRRC